MPLSKSALPTSVDFPAVHEHIDRSQFFDFTVYIIAVR